MSEALLFFMLSIGFVFIATSSTNMQLEAADFN